MRVARTCSLDGCERKHKCNGLCKLHDQRVRRSGSPGPVELIADKDLKFEDRFIVTPTCWLWRADRLHPTGYGLAPSGKQAHRLAYEMYVGPIPPGMVVDHKFSAFGCERRCVNPDHLRAIPQWGNVQNHSGPPSNNTSGVRGVSWNKQRGRWDARIQVHGKGRLFLGHFDSIDEAAEAVLNARLEHHVYNDLDRAMA